VVIPEETPIRTMSFSLDRSAYAKARLRDVAKQLVLGLILMLIAPVALAVVLGNEPNMRVIVITVALVIFVFVAAVFAIVVERIFKKSNRHLFEAVRRYEFTESTIYIYVTGLGESRYGWQLITKISKPAGWTFLMQSSLLAAAIPDSAFDRPEELENFRDLLSRKADLLYRKRP
jgi:hypothetical protein